MKNFNGFPQTDLTYRHDDKWTLHANNKKFIINNNGMKFVVLNEDELVNIIFNDAKYTIEAIIGNNTNSKLPHCIDLSTNIDFYNEIKNNIKEILSYTWFDESLIKIEN